MEESEVLRIANVLSTPYDLKTSFLGDEKMKTVGVGGDHRTYTRTLVLQGPFPGHDQLATISTRISNFTGINRVTYDMTPEVQENS